MTCSLTLTFEKNLSVFFSCSICKVVDTHLSYGSPSSKVYRYINAYDFSATLSFMETIISICFLQYISEKATDYQKLHSRCVNFEHLVQCFNRWVFLCLLTSIEDERWVKQSMNQSFLLQNLYQHFFFPQFDIVCTCRESRGDFTLYTATFYGLSL